jgi:hypothetical protein
MPNVTTIDLSEYSHSDYEYEPDIRVREIYELMVISREFKNSNAARNYAKDIGYLLSLLKAERLGSARLQRMVP